MLENRKIKVRKLFVKINGELNNHRKEWKSIYEEKDRKRER